MIIEADFLTTTQEVAKEVNVQHSGLLAFEANCKGEKAYKWVPRELTETYQKKYCFEVSSSSYSTQQWTISQSDCDVWWKIDFIQQLVVTVSVVGPRKSFKALPKAKLAPKKGHGHCLVVCCPSDPLQPPESPGKPLHVRSMLSNWWYTGNCNACSWHWATEGAQFCTTMPDCSLHNQHFKSWTNWTRKFCLIHHIHLTSRQPTTTSSSILTTFCRENTPTTSMRHKMLSKSSLKPKAWIFMLQE